MANYRWTECQLGSAGSATLGCFSTKCSSDNSPKLLVLTGIKLVRKSQSFEVLQGNGPAKREGQQRVHSLMPPYANWWAGRKRALGICINYTHVFSSESFTNLRAFGFKTLSEESKQAIKNDDIMMIFSLTKLMTSIAVLQCVERGLIQLDDDVAQILPDLAALEILEGHNSDTREWILRKRKNAINL
uniref:Transesterase n=1 Tax=Coccidioides posadasii RMSCC 3488 TaxID=454284 RepID=A0A0J6FQQ8_COCPO|nr:transesterase [Coccidioides posadasii RMSCC 3488]